MRKTGRFLFSEEHLGLASRTQIKPSPRLKSMFSRDFSISSPRANLSPVSVIPLLELLEVVVISGLLVVWPLVMFGWFHSWDRQVQIDS